MSSPNVVLIVLDAVRADHLSCYGYERETTPELDRIAREGYKYTNAFSNSNWTAAAHPPIFTGLLPSNAGTYGDSLALPDDVSLLSELLHEEGYATFGTSAGAHIRQGRNYDRGFDDFRETHRIKASSGTVRKMLREPAYRKQVRFALTRGPDDKTLYKFEALNRFMRREERPVFAFFNCKTAHYPYNPPRPFKREYCPDLDRPKFEFLERLYGRLGRRTQQVPGMDMETCRTKPVEFMAEEFDVSDEVWKVIKSWYDGAIRYLDYRIGQFVETLRNRGVLDDTYLIVTADHGEMFGEKGLAAHMLSLYDSVINVPLIVRPPGGSSGETVAERTSLIDLFNTILDMAGLETRERRHSRSLLSEESAPEYTFAEVGDKSAEWLEKKYEALGYPADQEGPLKSIRDDSYKLIWKQDAGVELYLWREDPREENDVSDDYPDVCDRLVNELMANTSSMDAAGGVGEEYDDELKETLAALGYR